MGFLLRWFYYSLMNGFWAKYVFPPHFISDFVWLATGGMNGCFNKDAVEVLSGREVVWVPWPWSNGQMEIKNSIAAICLQKGCHKQHLGRQCHRWTKDQRSWHCRLPADDGNTADGATKADKATSATPTSDRQSWVGVGRRAIAEWVRICGHACVTDFHKSPKHNRDF